MKNVLTITGAMNCCYDIYAFTDEQFSLIFPGEQQDIEFIEDVTKRLDEDQMKRAFQGVWQRFVHYDEVQGIHGTLFYRLESKKEYYPTKQRENMGNARPPIPPRNGKP